MYVLPKLSISIRGTAFTAKSIVEFCSQLGVKHSLNSVRHLQANGQVERVNGTLL